ncbi:unnamed protein product [Phaedon cochleariae]|uniref:FAM234A/B beta-propeller domain-containing protein n=1 Tax=Phaedon cochleariae TaxID=80249 RepID=A0A9P0GPU2_PHACE|nr:unnamed protein product [Phaedon cochleariae]
MKITYPGMTLRGEVRESISLDEDDLSDVEDEVFIRDGKNGYKLAEEVNVKRPLMAPRRKAGKTDINTRMKVRPPCRAFCKPCCYVVAALTTLIGLIILVVVLVSIYPLPLDRLRDWIIRRSQKVEPKVRLLPCDNLKVTDVWSINLPKLTTDSPVRTIDVDNDGTEDILFGFGTGDNHKRLPSDIFCPMFMGVSPPCEGGVIALSGINGEIIWRHWFNDTIFHLQCNADVNGDQMKDCLAIGVAGTVAVVNSRNGSKIWHRSLGNLNIFMANFIPDQNNDTVPDILASHSSLNDEKNGHLVLFSGKTGEELQKIRTPEDAKTFFMPQIFVHNSTNSFVIFGTGTPSIGGNLSIVPITDIASGKLSNWTKSIYEDKFHGVLTQSVLVDITGDKIPDIVTAMYNSSLVAIDGSTLKQIWNYTIPGTKSETDISPTPGYFNFDNVTDFLIVYQKYDDVLNHNYTQTFIIDGKKGESIYRPITGSLITQMSGLSLSLESHGYDMFLFWTAECTKMEIPKKNDLPKVQPSDVLDECRSQFNTTRILKLNVLGQFHQPPGFVIYSSENRLTKEFNSTKTPLKQLREYYKVHSKMNINSPGQSEVNEAYNVDPVPIGIRKYGSSSFRHKNRNSDTTKKYNDRTDNETPLIDEGGSLMTDRDYDWPQPDGNLLLDKIEPSFSDYPVDADAISYDNRVHRKNANRDPRSKEHRPRTKDFSSSRKKNLSDRNGGVYGYNNMNLARNRLFHDVNYVPTEIIKDTFVKNEEGRLKKSKFEQRDVNAHIDKLKEKEEIRKVINEELEEGKNSSTTLWDLESEQEMKDWVDRSYRAKRNVNYTFESTTKITSVGAILDSFNTTNSTNSIDIVFIVYWQPIGISEEEILKQDVEDCIVDKMADNSADKSVHDYQKTTDKEQRALFQQECLDEQAQLKIDFSFFDRLSQLRLGQMTVYRLRLECECEGNSSSERCAKFLPREGQSWPGYLGRFGDGVFLNRG